MAKPVAWLGRLWSRKLAISCILNFCCRSTRYLPVAARALPLAAVSVRAFVFFLDVGAEWWPNELKMVKRPVVGEVHSAKSCPYPIATSIFRPCIDPFPPGGRPDRYREAAHQRVRRPRPIHDEMRPRMQYPERSAFRDDKFFDWIGNSSGNRGENYLQHCAKSCAESKTVAAKSGPSENLSENTEVFVQRFIPF